MKAWLMLLLFAVLICVCGAQSVDWNSLSNEDKSKLDTISNRVYSGDYGALSEAAKMPAAIAVPYLYIWTMYRGNNNPAQYQAAVDALKQVPGNVSYLQKDIADTQANGGLAAADFEMLAMIGTKEAQSAVAPYLFDFTIVSSGEDDVQSADYCGEAVETLKRMKVPDAPSNGDKPIKGSDELIAWQKWAIAKELLPKEWSSRVGAPDWLLKMESAYGKPPSPRPSSSQSNVKGDSSATRLASGGHEPGHVGETVVKAVSPAIDRPHSQWIFVAVILVVLIGGVGFLLLRQRK